MVQAGLELRARLTSDAVGLRTEDCGRVSSPND